MPLQYVLLKVGRKMGMNPSDYGTATAVGERAVLLGFVNEAARELYDEGDVPGSIMEQVFRVNGDQTITLPSYVGALRAMREMSTQLAWHLNQQRPRYNQFNWTDNWRNWRLKDEGPLMATVTNQSVGVITVTSIEVPPIIVTVSGPTVSSTVSNESITMDALSKQTINQYLDYVAVTKDRVNDCDITLSDVDGKMLTVIPNNDLKALYQIVDVSSCPWLSQSTGPTDNYMEILFKKRLQQLSNDSDEYLNGQYDDIIVNKVLQLWAEEQEKGEEAKAYDAKATRSLARKIDEQNRSTEDVVGFVRNEHDTLQPRIGTGLRRRSSWGWGRGTA